MVFIIVLVLICVFDARVSGVRGGVKGAWGIAPNVSALPMFLYPCVLVILVWWGIKSRKVS